MENIIEKLQNFNFTRIEAQVYLCLLKNGQLNGSQVSKFLGLTRTSVYASLDSLYEKGHVFMLAGEPTLYKVQDPKLLIENIKREYSESIDVLENTMTNFESFGSEDQYWNIKGYENFIVNTKKLLLEATEEVYISTNFDIQLFREELTMLSERNVRVVLFSFENLNIDGLVVDYYRHDIEVKNPKEKRWMMVVDNREAFIANKNQYNEVIGTFTQNSLMVSIISEHIHHDIYLLKLKRKHQESLLKQDILIGSNFEKGSIFLKNRTKDK